MEFEGWYNLWKEEGGSTVGQAEGEGKLLCRTHKSWASLVGSCPIIQSKYIGCPREAVSWGEVALCRGRPLELTAGGVCWPCLQWWATFPPGREIWVVYLSVHHSRLRGECVGSGSWGWHAVILFNRKI